MVETFLSLFNPQNAAGLTTEQLAAMETLTPEQIAMLAREYPNPAIQNAYLVLKDTTKADKDQLWNLSTWQNLADLHRMGMKQFVAVGFRTNHIKQGLRVAPVQNLGGLDLSEEEVKQAEGLKKALSEDNGTPVATQQTAVADPAQPAGPVLPPDPAIVADPEAGAKAQGDEIKDPASGEGHNQNFDDKVVDKVDDPAIPLDQLKKVELQGLFQERFPEEKLNTNWTKEELINRLSAE